jgi:hypothetical protein
MFFPPQGERVMPTIVKPVCITALLLALGACSKIGMGGADEMTWARGALDRNDRLEVVASDSQAKTFTVRLKDSGQLVVLPLDQIIAGPAAALQPAKQAATASAPADAPVQAPAAAPGTTPADPAAPSSSPTAPSTPASPAPSQPSGSSALASSGEPAQASGGESTTDGASGTDERPRPVVDIGPGPRAQSAANARPGSVLASGPGYTIKASGMTAGSARPSPGLAPRGVPERLHDPIVCQGDRLLHIDNRNLEFDGDAITAEDGCEIHITNTHISARGIGVLARAANVHIKNSEIDGDSGAVDASDGAQVYAESSRFKGLTRRLESSAFHDLGGNVWN